MLKVYLDANILIASYFKKHIHHHRAKDLLEEQAIKGSHFYISSLTLDEYWYGLVFTLRSLDKKVKKQPFSNFYDQLLNATTKLLSWPNIHLVNLILNDEIIEHTLSYINKYNLKPRDAFHITYCAENQLDALATFDEELKEMREIEKISIL